MDLQYLIWLQDVRASLPAFVTSLFNAISAIVLSPLIILAPCVVYWCLDRRRGAKVVFSFAFGSIAMSLIKSVVCAYRPWVRSDAIHPVEEALADATGYSFPSGHTQGATSLVGSIGTYYRKESRALFVVCWAFVLLVGFSRNFLGVHTPQDVIVGLALGIGSILVADVLVEWLEGEDGRSTPFLVACTLATIGFVAFTQLKPYPLDVVDGRLLADPAEMIADCLQSAGFFYGAMLGWYLERRIVRFGTEVTLRDKVVRVLVGVVVVLGCRYGASVPLEALLDPAWLGFAKSLLTTLGAVFVAPWAFTLIELRRVA